MKIYRFKKLKSYAVVIHYKEKEISNVSIKICSLNDLKCDIPTKAVMITLLSL